MAERWTRRPEGSTWGDFGEDDQLGRLNLLTPEKVRQGVAEVQEGLNFCLSLPLNLPGGTGLNPRTQLFNPLLALERRLPAHRSMTVHAVHLEDSFSNVDTNSANVHLGLLLMLSMVRTKHLPLWRPGATL